jgi:hypothetical protein
MPGMLSDEMLSSRSLGPTALSAHELVSFDLPDTIRHPPKPLAPYPAAVAGMDSLG